MTDRVNGTRPGPPEGIAMPLSPLEQRMQKDLVNMRNHLQQLEIQHRQLVILLWCALDELEDRELFVPTITLQRFDAEGRTVRVIKPLDGREGVLARALEGAPDGEEAAPADAPIDPPGEDAQPTEGDDHG